jgi:hypothetical protein
MRMKALELTVYPRLKRPRYGYGIDPYREQWKRERKIIMAKRLTDAELASEFHAARADYTEASNHPSGTYWTPLGVDEDATADMALKRSVTFLHFAARLHYDEDPT